MPRLQTSDDNRGHRCVPGAAVRGGRASGNKDTDHESLANRSWRSSWPPASLRAARRRPGRDRRPPERTPRPAPPSRSELRRRRRQRRTDDRALLRRRGQGPYPRIGRHGCAFIDYDGDGRLDVFLVNAWALDEQPSRVRLKGRNALYRNRGDGTFEDVTEQAGVADESWGCGVCAGDYDNDGRVDLYVTSFGPNRLYRNRGDGTFEQVAERAGVADPGWGAGSAFFDADGDGDLDLYVAHYIDATMDEVLAARRTTLWREKVKVLAGPFGLRGGRDRFFRNNGDGTFRDATDEAGMTDTAESYGLGVLASDLDLDGDVDVFVANDSNPNFLYRNNGNGTFTEIGSWSGAGLNGNGVAQAGMGVDAADFDGDGRHDILVTTFAKDSATLYHNEGDLLFRDVRTRFGLKAITYDSSEMGLRILRLRPRRRYRPRHRQRAHLSAGRRRRPS